MRVRYEHKKDPDYDHGDDHDTRKSFTHHIIRSAFATLISNIPFFPSNHSVVPHLHFQVQTVHSALAWARSTTGAKSKCPWPLSLMIVRVYCHYPRLEQEQEQEQDHQQRPRPRSASLRSLTCFAGTMLRTNRECEGSG